MEILSVIGIRILLIVCFVAFGLLDSWVSVEDAVHCKDGCSALRGRLQCTASEMGKTGTEIASPILDRRKWRSDSHMSPYSPRKFLLSRYGCAGSCTHAEAWSQRN